MVNKPKQIGTAAETAVTRYARTNGFPLAERRALAGTADLGDILLAPGVIIEVKAGKAAERASDARILNWLAETERERHNAKADVAVLVTKRAGVGHTNAHNWWAHFHLHDLARLRDYPTTVPTADQAAVRMTLASALTQLRAGGYGTPLEETP